MSPEAGSGEALAPARRPSAPARDRRCLVQRHRRLLPAGRRGRACRWNTPARRCRSAVFQTLERSSRRARKAATRPWASTAARWASATTPSSAAKGRSCRCPSSWADLLVSSDLQERHPGRQPGQAAAPPTPWSPRWCSPMGEDEAFDHLKALHQERRTYARSGTGPIKAVARGETSVSDQLCASTARAGHAGFSWYRHAGPKARGRNRIDEHHQGCAQPGQANFYEWALTTSAREMGAAAINSSSCRANKSAKVDPRVPTSRRSSSSARLREVRRQQRAQAPHRQVGEGRQQPAAVNGSLRSLRAGPPWTRRPLVALGAIRPGRPGSGSSLPPAPSRRASRRELELSETLTHGQAPHAPHRRRLVV